MIHSDDKIAGVDLCRDVGPDAAVSDNRDGACPGQVYPHSADRPSSDAR